MERAELADRLGARSGAGVRTRVATEDPVEFAAAVARAVAGDGEVFLENPRWGEAERREVSDLLQANPPRPGGRGWLMVPTGGTSGGVRFARHDSNTLGAAVGGFAQHFDLRRVNAVGLLPLHHVSGLMAWLRCAATAGTYLPADWRDIDAGRRPELPGMPDGWVLSLVPTQLERLLREASAMNWLQQFRIIFLGGAPAWPELLERAAGARLAVSLSYGLTETAAMATALQPADFLNGDRSSGKPLPHVRVAVDPAGLVVIGGESVFRGYYPEWRDDAGFTTCDLGEMDASGRLTVLGRSDGLIITGGEKVHPAEVEAVLRSGGEFADVAVLGWPDAEWGQQVLAAYPTGRSPDLAQVQARVARQLAPSKRPKHYLPLSPWPRDRHGKLNRSALVRLVAARLQSGEPPRGG